jgi:L-ascorbate metabolism protein UlaG (beta-lactamase superfamily)
VSRWLARIGIFCCVVLVLGLGYAFHQITTYGEPAVDPRWAVPGDATIPRGAVTVRWTGTSTLVFSDGETTWMTDGWFSRPGPLDVAFGDIAPDLAAIEAGLARNRVERAAAVFPVHSHYDHAMDAPEVARRTGALLLGSESTANIGRGWALPESQIRVVTDREPIPVGRFVLTPIESRHFQFPDPMTREMALGDPEITEPLVPPVGTFDYKLGKAYVLHVSHPLGSWLIVGSAGFVEGGLDGFDADVVFLGTGGIGSQTADYREQYWRETIGYSEPDRVIPIHWDSLTGPIEGPFTGPVSAASFLSKGGDEALAFLQQKARENYRVQFLTLPRYDEVVLFAPRSGRPPVSARTGRRSQGPGPLAAAEAVRGPGLLSAHSQRDGEGRPLTGYSGSASRVARK